MMWKPTKAGVYLWCNRAREVVVEPWGEIIVGHGPWSILAPDWQPGAPTVAQLERWPWWAMLVVHDVSVHTALVISAWVSSGELLHNAYGVASRDIVTRSAPIQPDLSNGPLWVPLEVAK